jgi:hypothetical protein
VTATAVQLPFVRESAARTGRRLFRVQVLPKATVEHPVHGPLDFTEDRLRALAERFRAGAMDQVPFLIADEANRHTDDPERFRGEVKGVELADDGLYATVETTERGAQLLADNPRLPVSVRVKTPDVGAFKGQEVLAHVLGTLDPVAVGMRPWEAIDAADDTEVCDLTSEGCYKTVPVTEPQTPPTGQTADLSAEEEGKFRSFLSKIGIVAPAEQTPPAGTGSTDEPLVLTEEELTALTAGLDPDDTTDRTPAAVASLSDEDRATLDLANQRAERAEIRAGTAELSNRLSGYIAAGVPPSLVNAARAQLIGDTDEHKAVAMDFANGREPAAAKALFATLDAAKGTIDFSEKGSAVTDPEADARKAKLDAWEKASG